jgi:hypothetical protein
MHASGGCDPCSDRATNSSEMFDSVLNRKIGPLEFAIRFRIAKSIRQMFSAPVPNPVHLAQFCDVVSNRQIDPLVVAILFPIAKSIRHVFSTVEHTWRINFAIRKRIANSKGSILRFETETQNGDKCMGGVIKRVKNN